MPVPTPGQKNIPLADWKRFLRVADWYERTIEQGKGVLRPTYGAALIVKTPAAGIDARDGSTIFSATCVKCVAAETSTPGERTLHETDEELLVWNFDVTAVAGDTFVKTALSPKGTRYAELTSPWHWAKLDGALAFDGTATASVWDGAPLADTTDNLTVYPPPVLTSGSIASGTWVRIDLHRNGRWYVIIAECP